MNRLQRNGALPTVWIPPGPLRELCERTRMVLVAQLTRWKNRLTATLAKYGAPASDHSDPFGEKARAELEARMARLPPQALWVSPQMLKSIKGLREQIEPFEKRLMSLPGVGVILAATIALEIGEVKRFPSAEHLAAYAGTTPRVHASGGQVRYGRTRLDVNRYLKWAIAEAGNSVAVNHLRCPGSAV